MALSGLALLYQAVLAFGIVGRSTAELKTKYPIGEADRWLFQDLVTNLRHRQVFASRVLHVCFHASAF